MYVFNGTIVVDIYASGVPWSHERWYRCRNTLQPYSRLPRDSGFRLQLVFWIMQQNCQLRTNLGRRGGIELVLMAVVVMAMAVRTGRVLGHSAARLAVMAAA
jgi:hypothetical protein